MSPQRTNLVLSAYIPHIKFDVLISDCFHIEADCGDSSNVLVKLELVKYC